MHSQQGSEPPRGKRRQPSPVKLKALLARSQVRLQYGRALALLRGPIWQTSWREAALPWASLAQTCLAFRLPPQEEASCTGLGDATGAFLALASLLPCLCTSAPGVLGEGLGAGGSHTAKGSSSESSVRGRERQLQGSSRGYLSAQTQRRTERTRLSGRLAWVCSPAHPEADSVGAQPVHDRHRFPSTLLPSRDMCRLLGTDPACLGSPPQPQVSGSSA